jgi:hypothetical protein
MASIYVKNKIYTGYDGNKIGYQISSSVSSSAFSLVKNGSFFLSYPTSLSILGDTYTPFSGSFQELRFYRTNLSESKFDDYVMNPYSIEGNQEYGNDTSLNNLILRAPLGTMLDNGSDTLRTSIHPKLTTIPSSPTFRAWDLYVTNDPVTGPYVEPDTPDYVSRYYFSNDYSLGGIYSFNPQTEIIYQDSFVAGIKNSVSEKIRIVDVTLPEGDTLSPYISVQQASLMSRNFNKDINYVEAGFSPQDEINDDIIEQLGPFNIGNYIGDPRQVSSSLTYYPDFNKLRDEYFSKYTHNFDLWDYIRLIKFYDNSLFKMIQDFTPARAGLATGIIIKQTLLERNRYPLPQATTNSNLTFVGSPTSKTLNIAY